MKKTVPRSGIWLRQTLTTAFFIFIFLSSFRVANAQESSFEAAYQDYVQAQTVYSRADLDYQKAKSFYLKNQTLALKDDARNKTLIMLRARDEVVKTYLTVLKSKILETNGLNQTEKDTVLGKVDSELLWYKTHGESYKDSDSLENLFNKSQEVETRYKTDTPIIFYDALFNISFGEVVELRLDHEDLFTSIKETLDKNVAEGKLEPDPFTRWQRDVDSVIYSLQVNEVNAKKEMAKLYAEGSPLPSKIFTSAVEPFLYSTALLKQFNSFLSELLISINTQL